MAARPVWSGFLKLSLISVPVKAYTATDSSGEVHLNQLHAGCNTRVQLKKTCPIHGELQSDQIVSGYEHAKGQYVVIVPDELDKLRTSDFLPRSHPGSVHESGSLTDPMISWAIKEFRRAGNCHNPRQKP